MKLYGLYGRSGTGKSHRATEVMEQYGVDALIDDGLLIHEGCRRAGRSAKNESAVIAATKRATFFSEGHRQEVMEALEEAGFTSLLLLGTSKRMIRMIVSRLELEGAVTWIPVEEVQSPDELHKAAVMRSRHYHVIPVKPEHALTAFVGRWFQRLLIRLRGRPEEIIMVQPVYASADRIVISKNAVKDYVLLSAVPGIDIEKIRIDFERIRITAATGPAVTMEDLMSWRDGVVHGLQRHLQIVYTMDVSWRTIHIES
ncbi:hypothetical protein [Alkalicoccus chagannorensis]|uniref:hypothetical protein n=1 Tax=Alkalicoccus chagannorensis TaxID=427072 RepID=UPI0003FD04DC|nr:hypothetical protein [Alkalicoccus chagannorensis]